MLTSWFMGTPDAAIPSLRGLAEGSDVQLVVTRPDRPQGRHRRVAPTPVKVAAEELGLDVFQPHSIAELVARTALLPAPDVGVVVAFGMILRPQTLEHPRRGFLNLHFSLLPRWRGAAPVERAIMAGDTESGVSLMEMDAGLDTGPVVAVTRTNILATETGGVLTGRLAVLGADLLTSSLPGWVDHRITPTPQDHEGATYAARIEAADRHLDPTLKVTEAIDRVRALAPAPGAQLEVDGQPHRLLALEKSDVDASPGQWSDREGHPHIGFADGSARVITIQPPGKRAMGGADWLRGRTLPPA